MYCNHTCEWANLFEHVMITSHYHIKKFLIKILDKVVSAWYTYTIKRKEVFIMRRVSEIKKLIFGFFATIMLLIVIPLTMGSIETTYTREGKIVEVHNTIVIIEDTTGNEWEYEATGFSIGDNVKMKMFNNYTDNTILDDTITSIKIIH